MAVIEVKVPDIGDFKDVPVIELLVKPGDVVKKEDSLVTLESDKAAMDVPAPAAGVVKELKVKLGDKVSEGSVVLVLEPSEAASPKPAAAAGAPVAPATLPPPTQTATPRTPPEAVPVAASPRPAPVPAEPVAESGTPAHASPGVRRFARELGVDLAKLKGSAAKGRIVKEDIQAFVKDALSGTGAARATGGGFADLGLPAWPRVDFAKFGPVEVQPLSRIKKISGPVLARNWVMIPHVTQFDEADITDLEAFRARVNEENAKAGIKVTPLAFLIKACVAALKKFPEFNASLDGDTLVLKRYWHIGFAADTPNGLVVPVLKDADTKGVVQIARETGELAAKAREGKLGPAEMQGGTFTISSLGGIGGTAFTPIINAPELAILGVSKASMKPVWNGREFAPRLMMPLSLSYDHRVLDGAAAARFTTYLALVVADLRRGML